MVAVDIFPAQWLYLCSFCFLALNLAVSSFTFSKTFSLLLTFEILLNLIRPSIIHSALCISENLPKFSIGKILCWLHFFFFFKKKYHLSLSPGSLVAMKKNAKLLNVIYRKEAMIISFIIKMTRRVKSVLKTLSFSSANMQIAPLSVMNKVI